MMKRRNKCSLPVLTLVLMTGALLWLSIFSKQVMAADPAINITATADSASSLLSLMKENGNMKITLSKDISGTTTSTSSWCELGTGLKVLELEGHKISISNNWQRVSSSRNQSLFYVGKGAELVINDSKDTGYVHYDGKLALDGTLGFYKEIRNIVRVDGGTFTLNGGTVEAGRSDKFYSSWDAAYYWRQINGSAVVLEKGEVNIQGGTIIGRGYIYNSDGSRSRCAAVYATGGRLNVYDGEFWGKGDANVLSIGDQAKARVYGGTFDLHRFDKKIAYESDHVAGAGTEAWGFTSSYGKIGIPAWTTKNGFSITNYYKSNRLMDEQACIDGAADNTSGSVIARPRAIQEHLDYETHKDYQIRTCEDENEELMFEWDKDKRLAFGINVPAYFPMARSFDRIKTHEYPGFSATIATSPDARKGVNAALTDFSSGVNYTEEGSWSGYMVDLAKIPKEALADLKGGHTYYVLIKGTETWQNKKSYTRTVTPYQTVKIHIADPDETWKNFEIEVKYDNQLDHDNHTSKLVIRPVGFASKGHLDTMKYKDYIDNYEVTLSYQLTDGTTKSRTFSPDDLPERNWVVNDARCGANRIACDLRLYKNGNLIGEKHAEATAVHFPYFTTSNTQVNHAIMFAETASNKTVTINSNADNLEGLFWTRDDAKIPDAGGRKTINVQPETPQDTSWYSLGYSVNGQEYFSGQHVIIGVNDGIRSASISADGNSCTVINNGDTTPAVTVKAEGSEWITPLTYYWYSFFKPADGPAEKYRRTETNVSDKTTTKNLAWIRNCAGSESALREGDYTVYCKIGDSQDHMLQTQTVTIHVVRGAAGMKVYSHDVIYNGAYDPYDVTDRFIINHAQDDPAALSLKATPEHALFKNQIGAASTDDDIAHVDTFADGSCMITGKKPGYATVTWTTNGGKSTIKGKTTVLTPRSRYSLSIPEVNLEAKVGAAVRDGELTVPDGENFSAELIWYTIDGNRYDGETFAGNQEYYPMIRIRPDAGVGYPGTLEDSFGTSFMNYWIDKDAYVITVNGKEYYGATRCGRGAYLNAERGVTISSPMDYAKIPASTGDSDDYIDLELASSGILIDPKDDYLNRVTFTLNQPMAGTPKDQTEDEITNLSYSVLTEGVFCGGDSVVHITDPSTIEDDSIANDKFEKEFATYEEGQTYRANVLFLCDSGYRNAAGGKVFFTDDVEIIEPDCKTMLDKSLFKTGQIRQVFVYFTIRPKDQDTPADISPGADSLADMEEKITAAKGEKDVEGSSFALLQARGAAKSSKSIKLTWKKVPGATQYIIYGAKCGKKNRYEKIKAVTKTSCTLKKLKKGTYYKYIVVAAKGDKSLAVSKSIHVVTDGGKCGNNTKVTLSKKTLTLKAGKTKKLKAKLKSGKKKVSIHRKVAWESDDETVATVKGGKIKAVAKGSCYVYAYAQNGVSAKVKVTVK